MDIPHSLFTEYGIWAVIILMIMRDLMPIIVNKWFPQLLGQRNEQTMKRLQMEQDEIKHRQEMEMRQITAMEKISESLVSLQLLSEAMNIQIHGIDTKVGEIAGDVNVLIDRANLPPKRGSGAQSKAQG